MDLQETEWEDMDWVNLAQEQVVGFCKHGIETSGSIKLGWHFLTRCKYSFSRWPLLQQVGDKICRY